MKEEKEEREGEEGNQVGRREGREEERKGKAGRLVVDRGTTTMWTENIGSFGGKENQELWIRQNVIW